MNKGGLHSLNSFITAKAKIAAHMKIMEAFEVPNTPQVGKVIQMQIPNVT